ncbi:glucuronosyltransferase [Aureimonas leprariae]|uniref:Glucuronosyltransferase n=1 Tax=Plantimonas leprariae TaxID=2615207 RepID=A0A7V7TVV6_9HYPH|nr:glucuronosyltransferase [Aureimonas leprariae]KAB0678869.1 glucuronosyltransferase [Aureimonas leprariae]
MARTSGKVMAVASGGGHWEQLQIICGALAGEDVLLVTTAQNLLQQIGKDGIVVRDCNRNKPLQTLECVWQCLKLVLSVRPKAIISTGAAPGLICLAFGRLTGARTIWVDSFANVEKLSMSGKMARWCADVWLTQWEHLAAPSGPSYAGEVL